MNLDELDDLNRAVTNQREARDACLKKWTEIEDKINELDSWTSRVCGFCSLASNAVGIQGKCRACPKPVAEICETSLARTHKQISGLGQVTMNLIQFMRDYKITDGSDIPEAEGQ